jgi:hypothetical protein
MTILIVILILAGAAGYFYYKKFNAPAVGTKCACGNTKDADGNCDGTHEVPPVVEPVAEPVIETVTEPVIETVTEPVVEPVITPAVEPVVTTSKPGKKSKKNKSRAQ